jgi:predicted Zn-dependent peptidase
MGRVIDPRDRSDTPADLIAEALDERGVSLQVATTRHTTAILLHVPRRRLRRAPIDHRRCRATARRFPKGNWRKRRAESITALRQDEDNPAVRASQALSALLYGDEHPYGRALQGVSGDARAD